MPTNYPSPYVVQWKQTVQGLEHTLKMAFNVDSSPTVGSDPSVITTLARDGSSPNLLVVLGALFDQIKTFYNADTAFSQFELFKSVTGTSQLTYVTDLGLSYTGTNGGATTLAGYQIYTFRTSNGGIFRLTFLEAATTANGQVPYSGLGASAQTMIDYIIDTDTPVYTTDNGYPIGFLKRSEGQNEKIWRSRYRQ